MEVYLDNSATTRAFPEVAEIVYKAMTEDEKKAAPIVGALMPIKSKEAEVKAEAVVDVDDDDDDLPF